MSANGAPFTVNASAYAAGPGANGVNGHREGAAGVTAVQDRERPGGPYTADRPGRRRLALDFLRAKETEQPPPSPARFAERVGVAPATMSKAMREWREDDSG